MSSKQPFFEQYLNRPDISSAIFRDADIATVLPEDMPRPDTIMPQVFAVLRKNPELYALMDRTIFDRWGFKPEHLDYLVSGEEAVVFRVYGAPFIIKATTSPDSDIIHGSQFVAKPTARMTVMLDDNSRWDRGERPIIELILERYLYPYNAYEGASHPEKSVLLKRENKTLLENCLLHEGLRFKDQKISNVRYYGVDTVGVDGSLTKGFPEQPVVTDVGALERVNPQRNRLASDTNESEHIYQSTRKRYLDMHSKVCPARGLDPAKEISQLAEYRLQQDMRLLQKLKQDGLSDNEVVNRNLTLAEARRNGLDANFQLLYNPSMILNR